MVFKEFLRSYRPTLHRRGPNLDHVLAGRDESLFRHVKLGGRECFFYLFN